MTQSWAQNEMKRKQQRLKWRAVKMRLLLFLLFTVVTFATVYSQFFGYPYYGYGYGMYPGMSPWGYGYGYGYRRNPIIGAVTGSLVGGLMGFRRVGQSRKYGGVEEVSMQPCVLGLLQYILDALIRTQASRLLLPNSGHGSSNGDVEQCSEKTTQGDIYWTLHI
ncbi:hypothetical protein RB195_014724 [Necator americanus]|uniref:Glycine zipper 2TM domain-containing protein n=1 Tax=Necator americanus TaxID=51031 RepID=A0ABR1E2L4_NECAM